MQSKQASKFIQNKDKKAENKIPSANEHWKSRLSQLSSEQQKHISKNTTAVITRGKDKGII